MWNGIGMSVHYQAVILYLLLRHELPQCHGHELTLRGGHFDPHGDHYHSHSFHTHRSLGEEYVNEDGIPICGFPDPSDADLQILGASHDSAFLRKVAKFLKRLWHADRHHDKNRIIVPTFYHIIQSDTVAGPSAERVREQHDHLVEAFAPYGFSFILKNVTFTRNNEWFGYKGYNTIQERRMKTTLRKGGPESLNIYVNNGNGVCGYAYLPKFYASFPWNDGVVINFRCFAGHSPSQEGDVVVHETGHWLGLLHTYSGCSEPGDGISDTPLQDGPTLGCPSAPKNSCGEGNDLVNNFMDLSSDVCRSSFTPGQTKQMVEEWVRYRS